MPIDQFDSPSHADSVAKLAYELWESRGRPAGSADHDWREAEAMLRAKKSVSKPAGKPASKPVVKPAAAATRAEDQPAVPVSQIKKAAVDTVEKAGRKPRAKKTGARDAQRPNSP